VTNTDPGLPNYKLMSRGNLARGITFFPSARLRAPSAPSGFRRRVYLKSTLELYQLLYFYCLNNTYNMRCIYKKAT